MADQVIVHAEREFDERLTPDAEHARVAPDGARAAADDGSEPSTARRRRR